MRFVFETHFNIHIINIRIFMFSANHILQNTAAVVEFIIHNFQ